MRRGSQVDRDGDSLAEDQRVVLLGPPRPSRQTGAAGLRALREAIMREIRIISEHRIFGERIRVHSETEQGAREQARKLAPGQHVWECKRSCDRWPGCWDVFVAKHEDVFALNE